MENIFLRVRNVNLKQLTHTIVLVSHSNIVGLWDTHACTLLMENAKEALLTIKNIIGLDSDEA